MYSTTIYMCFRENRQSASASARTIGASASAAAVAQRNKAPARAEKIEAAGAWRRIAKQLMHDEN